MRKLREGETADAMAAGLVVEETLHMVPGDGETSYARNSTVQVTMYLFERLFLV